MTSRETRTALAASQQATNTYEWHAASCPRCRKRSPVCHTGAALWAERLTALRELKESRALDAAPMPGKVALW